MQFDQTNIAIRERGFFDILDLTLVVIRNYGKWLAGHWLMAVVPLMLINHWILRDTATDIEDPQVLGTRFHITCLLVVIQAPLASLFTTVFLGRAVFDSWPTVGQLLRASLESLGPLAWCVLMLRAVVAPWLIITMNGGVADEATLFLLWIVAMFAIGLRAFRPYILEIILLERNPMRAKSKEHISIGQRSRALHAPNSGDLFGRFLTSAGVAGLLFIGIMGTLWFLSGAVLMAWEWGPWMVYLWLPLTLWFIAGFMSVVRFLGYLDLRIRCEGWESALLCRAAAEELRASQLPTQLTRAVGMFLAIMATTLATPGIGWASANLRELPWIDVQSGQLKAPPMADPVEPQPPKELNWKLPEFNINPPNWNFNGQGLGTAFQFVFWLVVAAIVVWIVFLALRSYGYLELPISNPSDKREYQREVDVERLKDLPFETPATVGGLLAAIQSRYDAGKYGEATVLLFGYELLLLDKNQWIRILKGKTNRQYVRELSHRGDSDFLRRHLTKTMHVFEDYFFGGHTVTRDRFDAIWQPMRDFEKALATATGSTEGAVP